MKNLNENIVQESICAFISFSLMSTYKYDFKINRKFRVVFYAYLRQICNCVFIKILGKIKSLARCMLIRFW